MNLYIRNRYGRKFLPRRATRRSPLLFTSLLTAFVFVFLISVAAADEQVPDSADIVGSWAAYQRLAAPGFGVASLDELLKGPRGAGEPAVVEIRTLLYRGARARQRAQELREVAKRVNGDDLRAIIDEVCDLVVLAIEPE